MPSNLPSHAWHVFSASDETRFVHFPNDFYTLEVCMTELDRTLARKFFRRPGDGKSGDAAGKEMTEISGINKINPNALVCDFAFDPCGYSMNGIDGDRYSTIHVTPEDGYSYASFECVGSIYDGDDLVRTLKRAVQVFRPAKVSVSTTTASHRVWARVAGALEPLGLKCRSCTADEFPAVGSVVFQTFTARRKKTGECGGAR